LAALASLTPFAFSPVHAQAANSINLPAGSLEDALVSLARQTGASIGMPGRMPHIRVKAVRGQISAGQALDLLLDSTGYQAVSVGPNAWRLIRIPKPVKRPPPPRAVPKVKPKPAAIARPAPAPVVRPRPEPAAIAPQEIFVTAAKRTEALETTPLDYSVVDHDALIRFSDVPTSETVASLDSGLTLTNLGPGRNKAFLRGISDSPFNGQTQSTVATLLDDARVTFNAPDPGLRLVDVDRVELLKGPQGPLYGTGAIGGVYRIVTTKPTLDRLSASAAISAETLAHGGSGGSGSATLNVPLVADRLALRLVAYATSEPGWIDNARPDGNDANRSQVTGGRLALRWRPDADWTVDLAGAIQLLHVNDSQYVTGNATLTRSGIAPEPQDNDFANAQLRVTGKLGSVDLFSTTSWTTHDVGSVLDASQAAASFGVTGPLLFEDDRRYRVFNQELRASGRSGRLRWMAGGSLLAATTRVDSILKPEGAPKTVIGTLSQAAQELALFGDIGIDFADIWTIDAGARLFATLIRDENIESPATGTFKTVRKRISPSIAVSAKPTRGSYYYIRVAGADRPAGLSPFTPPPQSSFSSDELMSVEAGGRWHDADRRFSAQSVIFGSSWSHIQSDYLLPSGLIATRNSGTGLIFGVEASAKWRVNDAWALGGGLALTDAKLEKSAPELAFPADRRLPIVPRYRINVDLTRSLTIGGWNAAVSAHGAVSGSGRLSLDPGLDRPIGRSFTLDVAANVHRGPWRFGLSVINLLDNNTETHPYGNPFSVGIADQAVPFKPRSVMLRVGWELP
jgi:iron complex outermembrane recepter protein